MKQSAYKKLETKLIHLNRIGRVQSLLGWDMEVFMPPHGIQSRSESLSALTEFLHERFSSHEMGGMISDAMAEYDSLDSWEQRNLTLIEENYQLTRVIPAELAVRLSEKSTLCSHAWREAKKTGNWSDILPLFENLFENVKETAKIHGDYLGKTPYDALIHQYDRNSSVKKIDQVFNVIRNELPKLIDQIIEQQENLTYKSIPHVSVTEQRKIGTLFAEIFDFKSDFGRLDESSHPFSSYMGHGDVRITTRYEPDNFYSGIAGIVHEIGHALYDQNLPKGHSGTPVGFSNGMKIHESQSLIFERHFLNHDQMLRYIYDFLVDENIFDKNQISSPDFINHVRHVKKSFIRVDADEVTYPVHVIIRYEIEKGLFDGTIKVKDIPVIWNDLYQKYLGITPENHSDGCLQDAHWYSGAFGYFPTYSLGAIAAAQLYETLLKEKPQIEVDFSRGQITKARAWLTDKIHKWGCLYDPDQLIKNATGKDLDPDIFLNHLRKRYIDDF